MRTRPSPKTRAVTSFLQRGLTYDNPSSNINYLVYNVNTLGGL
ncbi:MAG: hypothetical protein OEZ20_00610 [candidate division WOR-3 bacterium]|nr:hypothetical protein [candidate division WOR-3 bacterium]